MDALAAQFSSVWKAAERKSTGKTCICPQIAASESGGENAIRTDYEKKDHARRMARKVLI